MIDIEVKRSQEYGCVDKHFLNELVIDEFGLHMLKRDAIRNYADDWAKRHGLGRIKGELNVVLNCTNHKSDKLMDYTVRICFEEKGKK